MNKNIRKNIEDLIKRESKQAGLTLSPEVLKKAVRRAKKAYRSIPSNKKQFVG